MSLKTGAGYVAFTLEDFICDRKATYDYLRMDIPPVASFRVLQLPVKNRKNFGDWLNASWDERAAVGVVGTSPYPDIDHEERIGARILFGEVYAGIKLRGAGAALIAAPGREAFLDAMDALERDFGLPRGVASRRGDAVEAVDGGVALPAGHRRYIRAGKVSCAALADAFAHGRLARTNEPAKPVALARQGFE